MPFTLYKSSAGSGKTYTLVKRYLRIALADPENFRKILAITFTNKTAAEMKERIIRTLVGLASGEEKNLLADLKTEMGADGRGLETNARAVLTRILHGYSDFAIMTIDSFVYRIIRSFAVELSLPPRFDVDLNVSALNDKLVDSLIEQIGSDEAVEKTLVEFALSKMSHENKWRIEDDLKSAALELFKEQGAKNIALNAGTDFLAVARELVDTVGYARPALAGLAAAGREALGDRKDLFAGGIRSGSALWSLLNLPEPDAAEYSKKLAARLAGLRNEKLELKPAHAEKPVCRELLKRLEAMAETARPAGRKLLTALDKLKTVYSLALLGKLADLAEKYKRDNAVVPISDFNRQVNRVVKEEEAPFIYWHMGDRFGHYLVDEFQDTSRLQWENLFPLIENAVAEGKESLAVGDSKQAVYRWRAGDIEIMENDVPRAFPHGVFVPARLDANYRSRQDIVEFNNRFFACAGRELADQAGLAVEQSDLINKLYGGDVVRQRPRCEPHGYVGISAVERESSRDKKRTRPTLQRLVEEIRAILDSERGFGPGDIAILVRTKKEGATIAERLFAEGINVVSPDSLLLDNQPSTRLMLGALRYLVYGRRLDLVQAVCVAARLGLIESRAGGRIPWPDIEAAQFRDDPTALRVFLPRGFEEKRRVLARRPLYEAAEEIAREFGLNRDPAHAGYVQAFLEQTHSFSCKHGGDIVAFLRWWEEKNAEGSHEPPALVMPGEADAITIVTIHKAKGLEFPIVFVPFANWSMGIKANTLGWLRDAAGNPPFLVSMSHPTEETDFGESYRQEEGRANLDSLNLLYVAFTRAMEELYVFIDTPAKPGKRSGEEEDKPAKTVSDLIHRAIAAMDGADRAGEGAKGEERSAKSGEQEARSEKMEDEKPLALRAYGSKGRKSETGRGRARIEPETADRFVSAEWRRRLAIRRKAERLWRMDDPDRAARVDHGNVIHALLSMLETEADANRAVESLCREGAIPERDRANARDELKRILDIESEGVKVRDWFKKGATVLREKTVLLEKKKLRPDRVIVSGKRATVVDFKTGKEDPADARQVAEYATQLEKLGYEVTGKFILYTSLARIVRVY
ncbi:MAG: UvrD-helicase domain-containing protein [Planctomycetota bacterium]|nr:UvrD-helicase domain-containing protein [Planctomycetota bacterium]